ncbi:MAG: hypothetical protein L0Z48_11670 [candidate division Zixibacteria bacterium]|nr:hypothetical protein [candidate division Zixibacteria bacterium]
MKFQIATFLVFLIGYRVAYSQSDSLRSIDELLEMLRNGEISIETFEEALLAAEKSGAKLSFVAQEELDIDSLPEIQFPLYFNLGSQYSLVPQKDSRNYFTFRSPAKSGFGFFAEGVKTTNERELSLRRRGMWFAENGWEGRAGSFDFVWGEGLVLGRGFYPLSSASKPDDFSNSIAFPDFTRYNGLLGRRTLENFAFEAFGSLDRSETHQDLLGAGGVRYLWENFEAGMLVGKEELKNRQTQAKKSFPFASLRGRFKHKEVEFSGEGGYLDKRPAGYVFSATADHGFWRSQLVFWNYNSNLLIHSGGPSFGDYRTQEIEEVSFSYRTPRSRTKGFIASESWRPNATFSFVSRIGFWGPLGENLNRHRFSFASQYRPLHKLGFSGSFTKSDFSDTLEARQRWQGRVTADYVFSKTLDLRLSGERPKGFLGFRGEALSARLRWKQNRMNLAGWGKIGARTDRATDRFYYTFYIEERLKIHPELEFMARLSKDFNRSLSNKPSTFLRVELARPW